ncbi:MAG: CDP-alcohol phosphatidyltransferase family protein [Bacteroidota bacterium]
MKIWTASNILSFSRIILMIPASYFLATPSLYHREIAVLIILLAVTTDAIDGFVARKFNQISELGKVIDPLADKLGVAIVVVMLTIYNDIPLWFAVGILARDVIIFLAGLYIKTKTGIILPSMMSGKVAVSFLALYLVLAILRYDSIDAIVQAIFIITVVTLLVSFLQYTQRFFATIRKHQMKE